MTSRRRNLFVILIVLGLIAVSGILIATKTTRLGLDLKGGVQLVYQGEPTPQSKVTPEAIDRSIDQIREGCDALGVSETEVQRVGGDQISVGIPDVKNAQRAIKQCGKPAQLFFYDFEKNVIGDKRRPVTSLYKAVQTAARQKPVVDDNNTAGDQYYLFKGNKDLAAGPDATRKDVLSQYDERKPRGYEIVKVPPGTVVVRAEKPDKFPSNKPFNQFYVMHDNPELNGKDIKDPKQNTDPTTNEPIVTMNFTGSGRGKFHTVTRRLAQRGASSQIPGQPADASFQTFAVVLDREIITRPFINYNENPDGIDGRTGAQISGGFTVTSAQDLAKLLSRGALPINLKLISQTQVSATLGKQALHEGLVAGIVGFVVVLFFLLLLYRLLGAIAGFALVTYAILFFALIKLIPITLTLPGIAGLILTIGVAADSNIVIFERIKEELRAGRSTMAAISAGYKRGIATIIDANVVTLITAFILFILATSGVKGFAFTLGVGTIVSLFTAVMFTQAVLGTMGRSRVLRSPAMLGAGKRHYSWNFDFMGRSKVFFAMSGTILLIGSVAVATKGLNFGIDFESGTRVKTSLVKSTNVDGVRSAISPLGLGGAEIQQVNDRELGKNVFQISTREIGPGEVQKVEQRLDQQFGVAQDGFSSDSVGPTFGKTVAKSALYAIIFSLISIMAYVALRFEPKFAVPVVIALFHDLLITAGVYSLTGREVTTSTVAALLTILGFSLYDTVIVFDRIRENAPRMPRAAFSQIVNRSMSEVLTRSLATSFSTLLPVTALLLFGGDTLKDFAFALLVGIASGTYSSIFIASPVLTAWKEREAVYAQRRRRIVESLGIVPAFAVAATGPVAAAAPPQPPALGRGGRSAARAERKERQEREAEERERLDEEERALASPNGAELDGEPELVDESELDGEPELADGAAAGEQAELVDAAPGSAGDGAERRAAARADRKKRTRQRRRKHGRKR
jgi:SecD/SecF fusion protein